MRTLTTQNIYLLIYSFRTPTVLNTLIVLTSEYTDESKSNESRNST